MFQDVRDSVIVGVSVNVVRHTISVGIANPFVGVGYNVTVGVFVQIVRDIVAIRVKTAFVEVGDTVAVLVPVKVDCVTAKKDDLARVAVPDDGFMPVLATRLAALVLRTPAVAPSDRAGLLRQLVPLAASDTMALDVVLARMILGMEDPAPATLEALATRILVVPSEETVGFLPSPRVY